MNIRSFWHRGVNRIYTEAVQRWNEKEFTAQDGQTLRYMFFPCKKERYSGGGLSGVQRRRSPV